jgi:hypothetical protein
MSDQHVIEGQGASPTNRTAPARLTRRHHGLLDSMVGRAPKWKRANAQKHGVFSACPTIPGENPRDFIKLHSDLIAEWQPSGRTEHDLVFDLADLMWRKIRAQKYLQIILMQNSFDRDRGLDSLSGDPEVVQIVDCAGNSTTHRLKDYISA